MARYAYFVDQADGTVLEWRSDAQGRTHGIYHDGRKFIGVDAQGARHDITRKVEMKSFPSRHECNSACINASGRIMRCECACGGKNHGRGAFNCGAA